MNLLYTLQENLIIPEDLKGSLGSFELPGEQGCSQLDNWGGGGGGLIFIYSGSAQLISFEIYCFYGL